MSQLPHSATCPWKEECFPVGTSGIEEVIEKAIELSTGKAVAEVLSMVKTGTMPELDEMEKCVRCLALELPGQVHDDVRRIWDNLRAKLLAFPICIAEYSPSQKAFHIETLGEAVNKNTVMLLSNAKTSEKCSDFVPFYYGSHKDCENACESLEGKVRQ